jgi:spore germination cell wall hydrolase CwlJ-like protein
MFKPVLIVGASVLSLTAAHALPCFSKPRYEVVVDIPPIEHHFFHGSKKVTPKTKPHGDGADRDVVRKDIVIPVISNQKLTKFTPDIRLTTDQRILALALTLFGEARGEGYDGMMAVGWTIMNRIEEGILQFGEYHTEQVVFKYKQYSCWNRKTKHTKLDPNLKLLMHIDQLKKGTIGYTRWQQAKKIAYLLIHKKAGADPTHHATNYAALKTVKPYWLKDMKKTATIGNHTFYKKRGFFYRLFHGKKI